MPELSNESRVFAAIAYIFGLLIAVIMFLVKKEDKYVAYHAAQAILFDLGLSVLSFFVGFISMFYLIGFGLPFSQNTSAFMTTWFALLVVGFITLAIKVVFGWMAYTGSRFKLPFIGNFAEKLAA